MPESIQDSERGEASQEALTALEEAIQSIETAEECLDQAAQ